MSANQTEGKASDLSNVEPLPSIEEHEAKAYPGMSKREVRQDQQAQTGGDDATDMEPEVQVIAPATQGEFRVGAAPVSVTAGDDLVEDDDNLRRKD